MEKTIAWAKTAGLNTEEGLSYTAGDEDLYLEIVGDYAGEVEKRAEELEHNFMEGDMENFVIHVHALNSLSKTIGATEVFLLAMELEELGTDGDVEAVREKLPALLEAYRKLGEKLLN